MPAAGSRRRRVFTSLLGLALAAWVPGRASADGAFPDAQNLLTPAAWPDELVLATTFGVVFSRDAGQTWLWTCEQDANALGVLYQVSLPPRHRLYAVANKTLAFSDDMTCTWSIAGGAIVGQEISDVWVDRAVADRVFAIGSRCCEQVRAVHSVFPSTDGGRTFGPPVYVAPPGDVVTGVETSSSDSRVVYLTVEVAGTRPLLMRSADGGATWQPRDLGALLGNGRLRLVAVDADDPDRVFLMWRDVLQGEQLVLTEDGGQTVTVAFPGNGQGRVLSAFVRSPSGALLLATDTNGVGGLFRSTDAGHSFVEVPHPPRLRGFAVRDAVVYGATNNFADGYAIGSSLDDGDTWAPVMRYDQVQAVPACLKTTCRANCEMLAPMLWAPAVCTADAPVPSEPDAGTATDGRGGGGAGGRDQGGGGTAGTGPPGGGGAGGKPTPANGGGGGCGCSAAPAHSRAGGGVAFGLALLTGGLLTARRRRRPL